MKQNIPLIFIHVLWYPCCQLSDQKYKNQQTMKDLYFYDIDGNCFSLQNVKQVWSIYIKAHSKLIGLNTFKVKYLRIKSCTDIVTGKKHQLLIGYTNKKRIKITCKLNLYKDAFRFDNEIAIYHNCSTVSDIQIKDGCWILRNDTQHNQQIIEMIPLH